MKLDMDLYTPGLLTFTTATTATFTQELVLTKLVKRKKGNNNCLKFLLNLDWENHF